MTKSKDFYVPMSDALKTSDMTSLSQARGNFFASACRIAQGDDFLRHHELDMTKGRIWPVLLAFTLPLLIENTLQLLYNTADSIVVGQFVGTSALAAVGATTHIVGMLVRFFNGTATGAGVVISRSFGAGDRERLCEAVSSTIVLTLIACFVLTIAGVSLSSFFLRITSAPDEVFAEADLYLKIFFGGISGLLFYNVGGAIMRAMGDTKRPLYFLIICSVLNIALDLIFVVAFGWGIAGVAWATVIAQALSAILVMRAVALSTGAFTHLHMKPELAKDILRIGLPFGIQMAIVAFSNVFVQGYINVFGTAVIAGWGVYMKMDQYMMIPIQSMGQAVTVFAGQNFGAGYDDRAKSGMWTALCMMIAISTGVAATLYVKAPVLAGLFSPDEEVIALGAMFIRMCTPIAVVTCFNQIIAGYLRGDGDSRNPMVITLCTHVFFRQIYLYVMTRVIPENVYVVGFGYPAGWILCAVIMTGYYFVHQRRRIRSIIA